MQPNKNYKCIKCDSTKYEAADTKQLWYMPHEGNAIVKNFSGNTMFTVISCLNCGYSDYYKKKKGEKGQSSLPAALFCFAIIALGIILLVDILQTK